MDSVEYERKRKDVYSEWIRENISEEKVLEAKKFLESYDKYLLKDNGGFPDRVYRGLKNSFKVEECYTNVDYFMDMLTYLLLPEKKNIRCREKGGICCDREFSKKVKGDIRKSIEKESPIMSYYNKIMESKKDIVAVHTSPSSGKVWRDYTNVTLKLLGGAALFYYILISFLKVAENCHKNKEYKFPLTMSSVDGIAYYVFGSIIGIDHQKYRRENIELEKSLKKQKETKEIMY